MPPLHDIRREIHEKRHEAQDEVRRKYLRILSEFTGHDVIIYASAFALNTTRGRNIHPGLVQITTDDVQGFMSALHGLKGTALDLILHSPGGTMEGAEQIVQYLRSKYQHIRAIIPQNAMSAATMIACACDEIVMGKHSAIGPIDPQISFPMPDGKNFFTAPAAAILDEFATIRSDVADNPNLAVLWAPKITNYPHGFLTMCENVIHLAVEKVAEWLDAYMFKDAEKNGRALAAWLGDAALHKSHGRPISFQTAREKGLVVESLEDDQELQEHVLSVFHATMTTFEVTPCCKIIENQMGRGMFLLFQDNS